EQVYPLPVSYVVNQVNHQPAQVSGRVGVVPVPQAPLPQGPSPVWTYPLAGEAPVGPVLTAQGLLCTYNNASGAGTAFLRSVDLQTGQVSWSYDVRKQSDLSSIVIPSAVGGVRADGPGRGADDGRDPGRDPRGRRGHRRAGLAQASGGDGRQQHHHPSRGGGRHLVRRGAVRRLRHSRRDLGDAATGGLSVNWATDQGVDAMTTPVTDGDNVYVGITDDGTAQVFAIPCTADGSSDFTTWTTPLATPVTADLTLGNSALFVPNGTTMLALYL